MNRRHILRAISTALAAGALPVCPANPMTAPLARPTPGQLAWQDMELEMFLCLDPCTWQGREYDNHTTPIDRINPARLDTDQWVATARSMGAGQLLFVAKHTGGFCWWQTETSTYGVKETPWRKGKGDVVAGLAASCRKAGLKLALYLSPADDMFGAKVGGRCKTPEEQARYTRVFRQQWTELLSRYGDVSEVWFDGSSVIDTSDILDRYAPKAMVFQSPRATIRWVGNENGIAPDPCWNAVPAAIARSGVATGKDGTPDGDAWLPCECDARIRKGWFWSPASAPSLKTVDQLMNMYYQSVGHGAVLLLNNTPDTTGLIPETDVRRTAEFGAEIRRRFSNPVAESRVGALELDLPPGGPPLTHAMAMENIAEGERIREYRIEALLSGSEQWTEVARGTAIGHKKIDTFSPLAGARRLRLRVIQSAAPPQLRRLAAYSPKDTQ
jgi:alpha-L-fucosidase